MAGQLLRLSVVIGKASKGILREGTSQPSILRCARRDEGGGVLKEGVVVSEN